MPMFFRRNGTLYNLDVTAWETLIVYPLREDGPWVAFQAGINPEEVTFDVTWNSGSGVIAGADLASLFVDLEQRNFLRSSRSWISRARLSELPDELVALRDSLPIRLDEALRKIH